MVNGKKTKNEIIIMILEKKARTFWFSLKNKSPAFGGAFELS